MDRIDALRVSDKVRRPDPADETVLNGTPYAPGNVRGGAAPGRSYYRKKYLRDDGPDLDQWLDATAS
jgi:hypothetical protein